MNFDVYCDESGPELLNSEKPKARFMVIGSLSLPECLRVEAMSARFITAYVADTPSTLAKLKTSPKWKPSGQKNTADLTRLALRGPL